MKIRWGWQLLVAALLVVLLATLATFQYRWLGEVSQAERERMRASLRTRAADFTQEFDSELTRTYVAFHVDGEKLDQDPAATLAEAYTKWQSSAAAPGLVREVYVLDGRIAEAGPLRRFDLDRRVLEPAAWPPALVESLTRARHALPPLPGVPPPLLLADAVDSRVPALFVAVPFVKPIESLRDSGHQVLVTTNAATIARIVVVVLDADTLQRQVLQPLVAKYFGDRGASDYIVTVVRRDEPATVVFNSGDSTIDAASADVATGMFDLRMDVLDRIASLPGAAPPDTGGARFITSQKLAITIVRRANAADGKRVLVAGADDQGAWQVRVRHRNRSLDAIVAQSRRRNLAISLGVLGLLAGSVVLIIAAAQRQQRLARQQMEFVAAVSHELRTPLAVICSAGENLADGVVADGSQVKRYGTLIESEGRRLHDMVERVLEFAGVTSGARRRPYTDVDVRRVIADAVGGVRAEARERGITIDVHSNGSLPAGISVRGDAEALRSAVQNIVGNAVKYSASGGTVDVGASVAGAAVQIRVIDRGLGIDAADLPYIFKPFHRGRRAVEAQIRGTGVGLTVVRHVIDAHHGDVRVESRPGEGTTVIVDLPVSDKVSDTSDTSLSA